MFFVQMCYGIQSTFIQETGKKYSAELGVTVTHYENMVETSGWLDGMVVCLMPPFSLEVGRFLVETMPKIYFAL